MPRFCWVDFFQTCQYSVCSDHSVKVAGKVVLWLIMATECVCVGGVVQYQGVLGSLVHCTLPMTPSGKHLFLDELMAFWKWSPEELLSIDQWYWIQLRRKWLQSLRIKLYRLDPFNLMWPGKVLQHPPYIPLISGCTDTINGCIFYELSSRKVQCELKDHNSEMMLIT